MSHHNDDDESEELSGSENDDAFYADIEALRRACMINTSETAANNNNNNNDTSPSSSSSAAAVAVDGGTSTESDFDDDDDDDDDVELVRNIQNRLSLTANVCEPLSMKPLCTLPPEFSDDDDEDDFETLRAIQRRFSAYDGDGGGGTLKNNTEDIPQKPEQVHASNVASENEISNNLFVNRNNASEGFPDSEEACSVTHLLTDNVENQAAGSIQWHESDAFKLSMSPLKHSSFPKSAQVFVDAIKRNRSYQKFLRSKFIQLEARIAENKKLGERVKILKNFQVSCRKITGRALSQMKDPRVQLIAAKKSRTSKDTKVNDKKISATYGPAENSHVANYRLALEKCPLTFHRKKWSEAEKENLGKGIRQQFQEMVLQVSVDQFSGSEGFSGEINSLDDILASIKDLEITPEKMREFLPKVNWDQLASMYVEGRTGAECAAWWLNCEDPLINRNPWTVEEDKNILFIVQEKGITNWFDIAVLLGTNRTPFQCLVRYQRSLNACILKKEWTAEEDEQLHIAVEAFGECNWQSVASTLKGRTGTQCSNRWRKSLHPTRQRVGRFSMDEDKRLKVAVMLFGPKSWKKIAQFVPGRTQVQCRERWVNSLDPSLNLGQWTEEEDLRLKEAIAEHGYCWSKVAACMPSRTDSQCRRRWKVLLPDEVPLLRAARRMQKAALICNFVDRESERPALSPNDFIMLSEPEDLNLSKKRKRISRGRPESEKEKDAESCNLSRKIRSKRPRKEAQTCSEEVLEITNGGHDAILKKKTKKRCSVKNICTELIQDHSSSHSVLTSFKSTNGEGVESFVRTSSKNKKKFHKSHFKRSKCIELDENSQSVVPLPAGSLKMATTTGDVIEAFSRNNAMPNKKKRAHKEHFRSSLITKLSDKEPGRVDMVKDGTVADHEPVSSNLEGDTEALDTTLACFLSKRSKKRSTTLAKSGSNGGILESSLPCNLQLSNLNDVQIVNDKEPGGVYMVRVGSDAHHEPLSEPVGVNLEGDLEAGDITLACFLHNKSKERQPTHAKSGCNGGIPESVSHCNLKHGNLKGKEPARLDMVKGGAVAHHEPVREPVSSSLEGDLEAGDVTLACFLRTGLKKRQPSHAKSGNRAIFSSHVERRSELPSQGVDKLEGCGVTRDLLD